MILVLDHDDDEAELDFELKFQGTLLEISKMLEANGYKKPFEIIKRVVNDTD
jgi:hypothetical protein